MTHRWERLARRSRIRRGTQAAAVALLATGTYWLVAAPPAAPMASPAAAPVRYLARDVCPDRSEPVGTILCTGLTLHLSTGASMRVERAAAAISVPVRGTGQASATAAAAVSRDGRTVAYLDAPTFRFFALNLRTGRTHPLTPVLTGEQVGKQADLAISPDGRLLSVSLRAQSKTIVTDVENGAVRHVSELCAVIGLTAQAIYGTRDCMAGGWLWRLGPDSALARVGKLTAKDVGAGLSSNGKILAGRGPGGVVAFYDAESGKKAKTRLLVLPPYWTPTGWVDDGHILATSEEAFHTVNLHTGERASYIDASPDDHVVPR